MPNPNLIKPKQLDSSTIEYIKQAVAQDPYVLFISGGIQTISGQKTFVVSPNVPYSGTDSQTISKLYVSDQINFVTNSFDAHLSGVLHITGSEHAQGVKTFDSVVVNQMTGDALRFNSGNFTGTLLVPNVDLPNDPQPRSPINLNFFYSQNILFKTGDQNIIGNKTFLDLPFLFNKATGLKQPARFDQLLNTGNQLQIQINALAKASGSQISGFGGVISFNGESGNIIAVGRGNVTVKQQGDIAFISGALPILSGSGVHLIQGEQGLLGPYFHPRGVWHVGVTYSYLDFVDHRGTSFVSTTGHFSTLSNTPGTGGILSVAPWRILASGGTGTQGPRGAWKYRGNFNSGINYVFDNAVSYVGSTYGLSGSFSSGLLAPTGTTWFIIAKSGERGLRGLRGETGSMGAWRYRGDYDSGTLYGLNDAVTFKGSTFGVDELFVSGQLAPTGEGWIIIAASGLQGLTGAWQYSGYWDSGTIYYFNNAVSYIGSTYGFSGNPNSIGAPPNTGSGWYLIARSGQIGLQGVIGATGAWQYSGTFNAQQNYFFNNAVTYLGSTYGYSGLMTSGFFPTTGAGWYLIASSGTVGGTGPVGPAGSFVNSGTITGNFVNLPFYLDFPTTGLYLSETWVSQGFTFSGYAIGCTTSGAGPLHLSSGFSGLVLVNQMTGSIYQRDLNNVTTEITPFSFNSGLFSKVSGNFAVPVSGLYRVGLSIYSGLSGLRGLSFMIAGF